MARVSTNIKLDSDLKQKAKVLYSNLGMDLTTAITIFLKQSIHENGMPFKPTLDVPNATTVAALEEFKEMENDSSKYKRYDSFEDVLKEED